MANNIFPSTPQPFRAARIEGVDRQLLVNPMKGSGLDDLLKHQLGMERDKNKHDLAMQKSILDMVTKFRPGATKGSAVMGWHNPHQKKILEQSDNAMYGAIETLLKTDKPTTQDILKMQRQVGEATTRSVDQVAYEQSTHVKYRDKYNKDKENYHAGAYNAALEAYYNYDGEEPFDVRQLDPSNYTVENPYDVADAYLKRAKDKPAESLEIDPNTGIRYVEGKVTNLKEGLREDLLRRSGKSLGWDYDYMDPEEKQKIAALYPDRDSYINGMVESIVNTYAPEDEYTNISDVRYPLRQPGENKKPEDPYTKADRGKIETVKEWADDLGYKLNDAEARGVWEEVIRFGKDDRFRDRGITLQQLVEIVIKKDSDKYKPTEKSKTPKKTSGPKAAKYDVEKVKKSVYERPAGGLSFSEKYKNIAKDMQLPGSFKYGDQEYEYDKPLNPVVFASYYDEETMGDIQLTAADKAQINEFLQSAQVAIGSPKIKLDKDRYYKSFIYFMNNPDAADAIVERRYGTFINDLESAKIPVTQKALWLFNHYKGSSEKTINHIKSKKPTPKGVREN